MRDVPDIGEVGVIAFRAWIAASGIFGFGFIVIGGWWTLAEIGSVRDALVALVLVPVFVLLAMVGAGIMRSIWALPAGFVLALAIRWAGVQRWYAIPAGIAVGVLAGVLVDRIWQPGAWFQIGLIAAPVS